MGNRNFGHTKLL